MLPPSARIFSEVELSCAVSTSLEFVRIALSLQSCGARDSAPPMRMVTGSWHVAYAVNTLQVHRFIILFTSSLILFHNAQLQF
jgi:hypothetical protein